MADELSLLQESHQLTVEAKVELERTVENLRQQLRAVSAQYSASKRQVQAPHSPLQPPPIPHT